MDTSVPMNANTRPPERARQTEEAAQPGGEGQRVEMAVLVVIFVVAAAEVIALCMLLWRLW